MSQVETDRLPYKVKDISLAEFGRKEIELAAGSRRDHLTGTIDLRAGDGTILQLATRE